MPKERCAATFDEHGWRIELIGRPARLFAKDRVLPFTDWPVVARQHPGVALLLSLLDGEEAEPEGDGLRLSHATVAGLSSADAAQIGLPPPIPFTLFLSHDAPISDPRFNVRVAWSERDGTRLFMPQRTGTAFRAGT